MFYPNRSTEPSFFLLIRYLFTFFFCGLLFSYVFYSWNEFILNNNKPTVFISENLENITFPEFSICYAVTNPNNPYSNAQYDVINNVSCAKQFNNQIYSSCDNYLKLSDGCWTFTPYLNTNIKDFSNPCGEGLKYCQDMTSFFNNSTYFTYKENYHDLLILNISLFGPPQLNTTSSGYLKIIFNQVFTTSEGQFNVGNISNIYSISLGQLSIVEFSQKVRQRYSTKFNAELGFLVMSTQKEAVLDIDLKVLPLGSNSSYTILAISPKNHLIRYENEKYSGFGNVFSKIGGFYTAISSIFILFFGYPRLSPWGLCQTCLCWRPFRKSFKDNLAKRYISRAGIPLVDDPRKLPTGATSDDRIAILETLLKEYYLDTTYLDILKETRDRYIELNNIYHTLESSDNKYLDI
ncbi:22422_t:CDS:2 [Dentiscutata erythropus]|uniref:22422_t:CDS:1 n=1 Tax=Dentiscutata erythropus TaxID=1348616 RepID=A0A9N9HYJ9_9GLOM|nr:22422_t:CDS:2 [Dentiscutata erythropus]